MPRLCALALLSLATSCYIVPEGSAPQVSLSTAAASQFVFRGMTNVDGAVAQTEGVITLPTQVDEGTLSIRGWANWDLVNDTGDAWFPDGHGGEVSQYDTAISYSETYRGYVITSGLVAYALQNGDDFDRAPDGERGETKEFFINVERETYWDLVPAFRVHYDFDEVDGVYLNMSVRRMFEIDDELSIDSQVSLGYADDAQADWLYGLESGGVADLVIGAGLNYLFDAHTDFRFGLNYSTMIDSDIADWMEQDISIDPDTAWADLRVTWSY